MAIRPIGDVLRHIRRMASPREVAGPGDGPLLERFLTDHDESAFEVLVQRHGPMVLGVCRRVLRDRHASEDAFQCTFLVLLRKAQSLRRRDLLAGWLYGVAYRTALKARSRAVCRGAREKPLEEEPGREGPEDLVWRDVRPILDEELQRLPEKYRLPLVLCYLEGKTVTEAGAQLGWPAGTVAGRLARAKDQLRGRLTRRGVTLMAALPGAELPKMTPTAVPPALLATTIRSGLILTAGQAGALGAISPAVIPLMEGVLQAMFLSKLKLVLTVVLTFTALGACALGYPLVAGQQGSPRVEAPPPVGANQPDPAKKGVAAGEADDVANLPRLPALSKEKVADLLKNNPASARMKALLMDRFDAACTEINARWQEFLAGRGTLTVMLAASLRLLEAEREISVKPADQLVAWENHWKRMQELEKIMQARFDAARVGVPDLSVTRFSRIQAEIWVERAKNP
jgi:RNA polymerase sigma factor (sigma-70 family)